MITLISPLLRKFAFSNLINCTKAFILPFVELPAKEEDEIPARATSAEALFTLFTAGIIQQDAVFIR